MSNNGNHLPLSEFTFVERKSASRPALENIPAAVHARLEGLAVSPDKLRGRRLAVAVGSRGIANLQQIVRTVCDWLKAQGARPFIFPAMGSHGGGTAEGQRQLLADYGITAAGVGADVESCTDTVQVGSTPAGFPVFADRLAWESDGIVVVCRVKPHSDLSGKIESGMLKMMAVGMGKREGANQAHKQFWKVGFETTIRAVSSVILASGKIVFAVAVAENEFHSIAHVGAAVPANVVAEEEATIALARSMMPRLPFSRLDLLIVDEMGKNISGAGMDTKVIGRAHGMAPGHGPDIRFVYTRDLTDQSYGNSIGMGHADLIHERLFQKIDFQKTYVNSTTALNAEGGRLPIHLPDDRTCLDFAIGNIGSPLPGEQRCVWIRNTLSLDRLAISPSLRGELLAPEQWRVSESEFPADFDARGDLRSPFTRS